MSSSRLERLEAARRQRFVGRTAERELFQSALTAAELPFSVLYLFGPGGMGKTTLLREFAHLATQQQTRVIQLDARTIEAAPNLFLEALRRALGLAATEPLLSLLAAQTERMVILIDTVELLTPLDGWLRDDFLPQLPGNILVVMAGRKPPGPAWRTDPGWQVMMRILPLRNLSRLRTILLLNPVSFCRTDEVRNGSKPTGSRTPATRQPSPHNRTVAGKKAEVDQNRVRQRARCPL